MDEHTGIGLRHHFCLPQQVLHFRTARDDAVTPFFIHAAGNIAATGQAHGLPDLVKQQLAVQRLGQETEHAALGCGHGIGNRAVRSQHDHRQCRRTRVDRLEQGHAIHAAHAQIGDQHLGPVHGKSRQGTLPAIGRPNLVTRR